MLVWCSRATARASRRKRGRQSGSRKGHELLAGDQPQPQVERDRGVAQVVGQLERGLQEGLLEHVGGVDAALQPAVQAQRHHAAQALAVLRQDPAPEVLIPGSDLLQQAADLTRVGGGLMVHTSLYAQLAGAGTRKKTGRCARGCVQRAEPAGNGAGYAGQAPGPLRSVSRG